MHWLNWGSKAIGYAVRYQVGWRWRCVEPPTKLCVCMGEGEGGGGGVREGCYGQYATHGL